MRARSPIEMMVDKACGFDPNAPSPPRPPVKADDPETQAVCDVCEAAAAWVRAIEDGTAADATVAEARLLAKARALVATGW
jgi:hypothetical protein